MGDFIMHKTQQPIIVILIFYSPYFLKDLAEYISARIASYQFQFLQALSSSFLSASLQSLSACFFYMPCPLIDQAPLNDATSLTMYMYTTHTHASDTNIYMYIVRTHRKAIRGIALRTIATNIFTEQYKNQKSLEISSIAATTVLTVNLNLMYINRKKYKWHFINYLVHTTQVIVFVVT